jgi:hypothetical protein
MKINESKVTLVIVWAYVTLTFIVAMTVVGNELFPPKQNQATFITDLFKLMVTVLGTALTTITGYYYGSTASRQNLDAIRKEAETQTMNELYRIQNSDPDDPADFTTQAPTTQSTMIKNRKPAQTQD